MFNYIIKHTLKFISKVLFRVDVVGQYCETKNEPNLIIANHVSFLDGLLLGLFLPTKPVFVVHTTVINNPIFKLVLSFSDYLTLDPLNPLGMRQVVKLLESGRTVVIFPEGRITTTGSLMKVYDGPAFAALKTNANIIPVNIDGASKSYFSKIAGKNPKKIFPKVTLTILEPTKINVSPELTGKEKRKFAGEELRKIMQKMIFSVQKEQDIFSAFLEAYNTYGGSKKLASDMIIGQIDYDRLLTMSLVLGQKISLQTNENEKIGLLLPNANSTLASILGLIYKKRVPCMLNYTAGKNGIYNACHAAGIDTILTSQLFLEKGNFTNLLPENIRIIYLEDIKQSVSLFDKIIAKIKSSIVLSYYKSQPADNEGIVLFTSGSEGKPKGVSLSHKAILSNVAQIKSVIDINPEDRIFNALPMFHSFGLTAGTLLPIFAGAEIVLYPSPLNYKLIPEIIYDRGCTVLYGTSTFLGNYAKFAHQYDFYKLRYVIAGAEKLSDSVRNLWFEKFGIRIFEGYGATETAPVISVNTPFANKFGSVGQFLPSLKYKIETIDGIDEGGMLHVSGPNLMSGYYYYDKPKTLTKLESENGEKWYNTGDIVKLDPNGFIHILGRMKRFAKIAGEMVSLETAEKIAFSGSAKEQHAATSIKDEKKGEAIVLLTTDKTLQRDTLIAAAQKLGLPEIAIPKKIVIVEKIPLLGTGKIDYIGVKAIAEQSQELI